MFSRTVLCNYTGRKANDYNALTGNKHDGASRVRFFLFLTYFVSRLQASFTRNERKMKKCVSLIDLVSCKSCSSVWRNYTTSN